MLFEEFFTAKNRVRNNPKLQFQLDELKRTAEEYLKKDIPLLSPDDFLEFYKTGERKGYEIKYFERRGRLAAFALMLIFYNDTKYKQPLEDILLAICDESTWVLPAHIGEKEKENHKTAIDLFCAETAFALSEIKYVLSDTLSERIKHRIHKEVDERIIKAFLNNSYNWEEFEHNWSAVCASGVGAAFLYEATSDEISLSFCRIQSALNCFLKGYPKDGICLEGYGYWKYGFEFYIAYAELLRQYTDNEINLFDNERVKQIANFQDIAILRSGRAISFSDAVSDELPNPGTTHFLYGKYRKIQTKDRIYAPYGYDTCNRWQIMLRNFIWTESNGENTAVGNDFIHFYPDAQWYIKKTPEYILCAKGGNNAEPHNHNDVGSFFLDCGDTEILCDLGSGEYTREYFNNERYNYLVTSSRGHNVPIINGTYQSAGTERRATVLTADKNIFAADIASAYEIDGLKHVIREIRSGENTVEISTTTVSDSPITSLTERLVSRIEPTLNDNTLKIGNIKITFENADCKINSETFNNHKWITETVYLTDITSKTNVVKYIITFD